MVKPVKFILTRDEFLVIFKGDHIIYMYIFAIVLLLGTVSHCTIRSLCGVFPVLS